MGGVFISYRREDSAWFAGRVYDRLANALGRESVFIDVDNIPAGLDFVDVLSERVGQCDALVAIVGKNWLASADKDNRRRIDDPNDFVRIEIEVALNRNVPVIPVLIDGTAMPKANDLPDRLTKFARRQGIEISHNRFDSDAKRLTDALARIEEEAARRGREDRSLSPPDAKLATAARSGQKPNAPRDDATPAPGRTPYSLAMLAFVSAAIVIVLALGTGLLMRRWTEPSTATVEPMSAATPAPAPATSEATANVAARQPITDPSVLLGPSSKLGDASSANAAAPSTKEALASEIEQQKAALAKGSQDIDRLTREANAAIQDIKIDEPSANPANTAAPTLNGAAQTPTGKIAASAPAATVDPPAPAAPSQQWMNFEDFRVEYDRQTGRNYYPDKVWGRCWNGVPQRSAQWSLRSGGQYISLTHTVEADVSPNGAGEKDFKSELAARTSNGFKMKSDTAFQGCDGLTRHLTVWIKE